MWRRLLSSSHIKTLTLATASSAADAAAPCRSASSAVFRLLDRAPISASASLFFRNLSSESDDTTLKKKVEDVMPIATGHEREELEAELKGIDLSEIDHPVGPFGTKEAPAIVKSYYDRRLVGCPGGEGEDEHDVVWFWLKKGQPHECPVCSQYFELEVVGPGGSPDGHDDDDDDNQHH